LLILYYLHKKEVFLAQPIVQRNRKSKFIDLLWKTPRKTVCPNFFLLAHANGCSFAPKCSYCYLKSSLWFQKKPETFINTDKMFSEVKAWINKDSLDCYALNSGNLSDSLTFEKSRPIMATLVELFRKEAEAEKRKHSLLLVTKGGNRHFGGILKLKPCKNVPSLDPRSTQSDPVGMFWDSTIWAAPR
jgi:DNA repair photolyase